MPNDTTPLFGYFAFHDGQWHPSNADDPCSVKLYRRTTDGAQGAIDLDKLEALARAATPGPWTYSPMTEAEDPEIGAANGSRVAALLTADMTKQNSRFIAAANPAAVLDLIALARRAAPVGTDDFMVFGRAGNRRVDLEAVLREALAAQPVQACSTQLITVEQIADAVLKLIGAGVMDWKAGPTGDPEEDAFHSDDEERNALIAEVNRGLKTPRGEQACSAQVAIFQARAKWPESKVWEDVDARAYATIVNMPNYEVRTVYLAAPATAQVAWISVKDRLPEDSLAVLVNRADWDRACIAAHFDAKGGNEAHWQDEEGEDFHETPEYWMPIPGLRATATGAEGAQQQTYSPQTFDELCQITAPFYDGYMVHKVRKLAEEVAGVRAALKYEPDNLSLEPDEVVRAVRAWIDIAKGAAPTESAAAPDEALPISRSTYGSLEECEREQARRNAAKSSAAAPADDEKLRDAIATGLRGLYGCGRVWSAWSVGTMTEDDFYPADESDECIEQVLEAIRAQPTTQAEGK